MFDILVFLFENYFGAAAHPDPESLTRKLSAAGFEEEEISEALNWLSGLKDADTPLTAEPAADSLRCYSADELARLNTDCRGFLAFLEAAGIVAPRERERIIERAMAIADMRVSLERFKIIVLMVLWSRGESVDTLIVEELLSDHEGELLH